MSNPCSDWLSMCMCWPPPAVAREEQCCHSEEICSRSMDEDMLENRSIARSRKYPQKFFPFMLQYRDLTPDDYEMLCRLDDGVPKKTMPRSCVDQLPRKLACDCPRASKCWVCLAELEPTTVVVSLPCGHPFHPECVARWLTECKSTCPLCAVSVAIENGPATPDCDLHQVPAEGQIALPRVSDKPLTGWGKHREGSREECDQR
mmetsp:Transcript_87443/g.187571  ORF Transcript_87443/g.187571 Transcript_87443/m.187571 type:complete len:204 (+) Transcript_87443:89-700(+)